MFRLKYQCFPNKEQNGLLQLPAIEHLLTLKIDEQTQVCPFSSMSLKMNI